MRVYFLLSFFVHFLAGSTAWSMPISRMKTCAEALTSLPRFQFGQVTDKNQTPDALFASTVTPKGQPRLILTVGVPGSGKSTWVRHADPNEWEVLSIDAIRTRLLEQKGIDPSIPQNHFRPDILRTAQTILTEKVDTAIAAGKSIVIDQNNLTPIRANWTHRARAWGYNVEALVFSSKDLRSNLANVRHRGNSGISISQEDIAARYRQFLFFNSHFQTASDVKTDAQPGSDIAAYIELSARYPNLERALVDLPHEQRLQLESELAADRFDEVHFAWTPKMDEMPLDTPVLRNHPRIYAAITNKCNRACPWCAVYSNPQKNTFLEPSKLALHFPKEGKFDLQLEGGEPTIHPKLFEFVDIFRKHPNSGRLILITNGVKLPRTEAALKQYILRFGAPFTAKLSINHYLLDHDPHLIEKAHLLRKVIRSLGDEHQVIFNVRLRRGEEYQNDDRVLQIVRQEGLESDSNIFFLQRYGLASNESNWETPFTVNGGFTLINPDGSSYAGTLEERADKMGELD